SAADGREGAIDLRGELRRARRARAGVEIRLSRHLPSYQLTKLPTGPVSHADLIALSKYSRNSSVSPGAGQFTRSAITSCRAALSSGSPPTNRSIASFQRATRT